ncbi:hypothetical protein BO70DRAFT_259291, partial [Aspergillus heteromorphus CBS 117.55]
RHPPKLRLTQQPLFRNSLLAGVGFLELANAADFAANVWNDIPVPRYALILMAIGGPIALLMTLVAARDLHLSWTNVQLLRQERSHLQHLLSTSTPTNTSLLKTRLGVNYRELGTEIVDRILMDLLMGLGALLVGTGTLMAIWGANPRVYRASNLLSGYIGNGLAALFGVVNAAWSFYLVRRFQTHYKACTATASPTHPGVGVFRDQLKLRFRGLQWHAVVNGVNGLVAGGASLVTATMWYGYVVLIPCIISLLACNWFWRSRLGYDRPLFLPVAEDRGGVEELLAELAYVAQVHRTIVATGDALPRGVVDKADLDSVVKFVARNSMFESFCAWVDRLDGGVEGLLGFDAGVDVVSLSPRDLVALGRGNESVVIEKARGFLGLYASKAFAYRERYLLELVGYAV